MLAVKYQQQVPKQQWKNKRNGGGVSPKNV
jgi:hypothetical protein